MNVVLVMFKDGERRDFAVSGEKTVLGRKQDCDLRIPTKDVSREHCALMASDDSVVVKDLGSSNGTFINGKRVAEQSVEAGDRLKVGPVTFLVQIDGKPEKISPDDLKEPSGAEPVAASDDEETFDLSEEDFDLDDPISALEELEDEDDMP